MYVVIMTLATSTSAVGDYNATMWSKPAFFFLKFILCTRLLQLFVYFFVYSTILCRLFSTTLFQTIFAALCSGNDTIMMIKNLPV